MVQTTSLADIDRYCEYLSMLLKSALSAVFSISLLSISYPVCGQSSAVSLVRVPVAPPSITILMPDEEEQPWSEPPVPPDDEILLQVPADTDYFGADPPKSVWEAADVLRAALPPDYKEMLMEEWGYQRIRGNPIRTTRADMRDVDLAYFLFEQWVESAPETQLAKEFDCLSWGELSIGPFMKILVDAEAREFDREDQQIWRLKPEIATSRMARSSPDELLLARCQELIERDVDPDDL